MVGCFFERRQHEDAVLHFRDAKPCDTKDFTLGQRQARIMERESR